MKTLIQKSDGFSLQFLYEIKRVIFADLGVNKIVEILEKRTLIRPNHITTFNFFVGLLGLLYLFNDVWMFSTTLIICFILDNLDGYYARERHLVTKWGKRLDHSGDFLIGLLYLLKSAYFYDQWWIWLAIALFTLEMAIILKYGYWEIKFPARSFLFFYFFGLYEIGLLAQIIIQPLSLTVFLISRYIQKRKLKLVK